MFTLFGHILDMSMLTPHGACLLWKPELIWLNAISDALIASAFFAIAFLQSAVDKVVDSKGNLAYLTGHFASSPVRDLVQPMFWAITVLEAVAGVLCGLGALCLLVGLGPGLALWGLVFALIARFGDLPRLLGAWAGRD